MSASPQPRPDPDAHLVSLPDTDPLRQRDVVRARQIFVNRNLRMDQVDLVGFDMDHTLAVYHRGSSEELAFRMTLQRLVSECGYPPDIASIRYDPSFVVRGLVVDKQHGNLIKADRYNHVARSFHGLQRQDGETRRSLYRTERVRLTAPRYAWIDTLFALPEAYLYAGIVERLESRAVRVDYVRLYDDIRASIDMVHRDGTLKAEIGKDIGRFILRDPDLPHALHKLRSGGKRLFIATNSHWDYTDALMSHLLDGVLPEYPRWRSYFDYIVVATQKPAFFSERSPFLELDAKGAPVRETRTVERGVVYQGGNLHDLEHSVGISGDRVLYVGDHIYGDILASKKSSLWRTCMVVEELEDEIAHTSRMAPQTRRLRALEAQRERLDAELNQHKVSLASLERREKQETTPGLEGRRRAAKAELERVRKTLRDVQQEIEQLAEEIEGGFNPHWGFVFKEGSESSRFGDQVQNYACLYTSRASNFLHYSPMQYFRSPREILPHERDWLTP